MSTQTQPLKTIRPDMHEDSREGWQHTDSVYIDKLLMNAFTAHTAEEVGFSRSALESLQSQCLLHVKFLSELEIVYRRYQDDIHFDHDEEAFNEVIGFLSGVGASLAGVTHQLGFANPISDADGSRPRAD